MTSRHPPSSSSSGPGDASQQQLSRTSSSGSLVGSSSAAAAATTPPLNVATMAIHSDEEDSDQGKNPVSPSLNDRLCFIAHVEIFCLQMASPSKASSTPPMSSSYKERRREAHTQAEQKRRDAIKRGYDYLQDLIPPAGDGEAAAGGGGAAAGGAAGGAGQKVSKAAVLQRSIDYIQQVQTQKDKQEEELDQLKKEVIALQIMRANYEQLVKAHKAQPADQDESVVPAEIKFETFKMLMDNLFVSFNDSVTMSDFNELSGGVFSWLEEHCKPQMLQDLMHTILQQVKNNYTNQAAIEGSQGEGNAFFRATKDVS